MKGKKIPIINHDKCKPKKCNHECQRKCPVNSQGSRCIDIEDIAVVADALCIGCGICEKACPFGAIKIVNLPQELERDKVHQYGPNGFRLYRMPLLSKSCVMGILGANGIGKSTLIKILSGQLRPNFGSDCVMDPLKRFSLSVKQYYQLLLQGRLTVSVKEQILFDDAELGLSGGEQQLKACTEAASQAADVYIFDEPTNFLDIKQRMVVAKLIQGLSSPDKYVIVIDHDLSFLDYCSDMITVMYGEPGAYGIVARPGQNSDTINNYISGYLPQENIKIRDAAFDFKCSSDILDLDLTEASGYAIPYPAINIEYPDTGFNLHVPSGKLPSKFNITLLLGENGTGKTSFIRQLSEVCGLRVSFKPQFPKLRFKDPITVEQLLLNKFKDAYLDPVFKSDVLKPLGLLSLINNDVNSLSGGERQRLAITCCLAKKADIYLFDEPSAMLDIEQRMQLGKILKRFIVHNEKSAIVIEHDIGVSLHLTKGLQSRVMVFEAMDAEGIRKVSEPLELNYGMNHFLSILDITLRKDTDCGRYRINKPGSNKDREQKQADKLITD